MSIKSDHADGLVANYFSAYTYVYYNVGSEWAHMYKLPNGSSLPSSGKSAYTVNQ